jgi:hypothetical protein
LPYRVETVSPVIVCPAGAAADVDGADVDGADVDGAAGVAVAVLEPDDAVEVPVLAAGNDVVEDGCAPAE